MMRIAITLVLLGAFASGAAAEEAVPPAAKRLKGLVTVTADVVRIGDLVENAGASANIAVFRAPDLGQTGAVPASRVVDVLRPHDVSDLDTDGLSEVVVTRLSRTITAKEIEERIGQALAGKYGLGDGRNLALTMDRDVRAIHIEASASAELVIARMSVDPRTGRFDVSLDVPGSSAARRLPLRFTGAVMQTVEAATLARPMTRGEIIRAADIVVERRPRTEVAGETTAPDDIIGLSIKRPMRAGQIVRSGDLMKPEVVQRNETVTIVYDAPGMFLTVRGKALEAGATRDTISVLNVQSNRTVQATVVGPGRVSIAATTPVLPTAVASVAEEPVRSPSQ